MYGVDSFVVLIYYYYHRIAANTLMVEILINTTVMSVREYIRLTQSRQGETVRAGDLTYSNKARSDSLPILCFQNFTAPPIQASSKSVQLNICT